MPLPGAHIVVLQNGRPAATGESDAGGRYRTKLPTGAYEIKVTHDQFVPGLERISLSGGQTVQRRILLRPTGVSVETPPADRTPPTLGQTARDDSEGPTEDQDSAAMT